MASDLLENENETQQQSSKVEYLKSKLKSFVPHKYAESMDKYSKALQESSEEAEKNLKTIFNAFLSYVFLFTTVVKEKAVDLFNVVQLLCLTNPPLGWFIVLTSVMSCIPVFMFLSFMAIVFSTVFIVSSFICLSILTFAFACLTGILVGVSIISGSLVLNFFFGVYLYKTLFSNSKMKKISKSSSSLPLIRPESAKSRSSSLMTIYNISKSRSSKKLHSIVHTVNTAPYLSLSFFDGEKDIILNKQRFDLNRNTIFCNIEIVIHFISGETISQPVTCCQFQSDITVKNLLDEINGSDTWKSLYLADINGTIPNSVSLCAAIRDTKLHVLYMKGKSPDFVNEPSPISVIEPNSIYLAVLIFNSELQLLTLNNGLLPMVPIVSNYEPLGSSMFESDSYDFVWARSFALNGESSEFYTKTLNDHYDKYNSYRNSLGKLMRSPAHDATLEFKAGFHGALLQMKKIVGLKSFGIHYNTPIPCSNNSNSYFIAAVVHSDETYFLHSLDKFTFTWKYPESLNTALYSTVDSKLYSIYGKYHQMSKLKLIPGVYIGILTVKHINNKLQVLVPTHFMDIIPVAPLQQDELSIVAHLQEEQWMTLKNDILQKPEELSSFTKLVSSALDKLKNQTGTIEVFINDLYMEKRVKLQDNLEILVFSKQIKIHDIEAETTLTQGKTIKWLTRLNISPKSSKEDIPSVAMNSDLFQYIPLALFERLHHHSYSFEDNLLFMKRLDELQMSILQFSTDNTPQSLKEKETLTHLLTQHKANWNNQKSWVIDIISYVRGKALDNALSMMSSGESRQELLSWLNDLLALNYNKIEQVGTGAAYCQIFDSIYGDVPLSKVKFDTFQEYEYINNFKVLQKVFLDHKIDRMIPVERLTKCKFQDNLEFLQWVKKYWETYYPGGSYDALKRRRGGSGGAKPAPVRKVPSVGSVARSTSSAPNNTLKTSAPSPAPKSSTATKPSNINQANDQMKQITQLQLTIDGLEKERDFYFSKLRDVEVLTQSILDEAGEGTEVGKVMKDIQAILYSTEEGFEVPQEGQDQHETF